MPADGLRTAGVARTGRLTGIEAGRGIAALLVVAVHARGHLLKAFGQFPHQATFAFGHSGVDFFFVLSGFIILHVHWNDVGQPGRLGHYVTQRVTRVLPLYWVVLALSLALLVVHHPLPSPSVLANAALLLPLPLPLPVPVAWTLQHEIVFYFLFAILIVNRRLGLAVFAAWLLLITCNVFAKRFDSVISTFDAEFFLGIFTAVLVHRVRLPHPFTLLLSGVTMFFTLGAAEDLHWITGLASATHLAYGLASMLFVLGAVELERRQQLRVPQALLRLGRSSYSLYMTHLLSIGAIWQLLVLCRLDAVLPIWIEFALFVAGAVLIGLAVTSAVEMPLIALARRLLSAAYPQQRSRHHTA